MSRKSRSQFVLTRRALDDIQSVLDYSTERWGKHTAEKYVDDLEAGLQRLKEDPDLLRPEPDLHPALGFYRVNKHLLMYDRHGAATVVLTVIHASMDLSNRLAELQPTLATEIEMLHRKLHGKRK